MDQNFDGVSPEQLRFPNAVLAGTHNGAFLIFVEGIGER
jgi:hypothetical protein